MPIRIVNGLLILYDPFTPLRWTFPDDLPKKGINAQNGESIGHAGEGGEIEYGR